MSFLNFLYDQLYRSLPVPTRPFTNQTIIITGSNTGLGLEAARHIVNLGATTVILAVRDLNKGETAKRDIEATTNCKAGLVQVWALDLSSFSSIQSFADRCDKELDRIDGVLANAGVATEKFRLTNGFETNVAVNSVGTAMFVMSMLPVLRKKAAAGATTTTTTGGEGGAAAGPSSPPRLAVVTSEVHGWASFNERLVALRDPTTRDDMNATPLLDALNDPAIANMSDRYPVSKLLGLLWTRQLVAELSSSSSSSSPEIAITACTPGLCHSELTREGKLLFYVLKLLLARTTEQGSRTLVHAVEGQPGLGKGEYLSSCLVTPLSGLASEANWEKEGEGMGRELQERVWRELNIVLERGVEGVVKKGLGK